MAKSFRQNMIELNYSENDIEKVRYVFAAFYSEFSKLIIMELLFLIINKGFEFLISVSILLLIRTNSGGLHFKHYWSCLLFSTTLLLCAIILLPAIPISKLTMILCLILCIVINYNIKPVRCIYRPAPDEKMIRNCHISTFKCIFFYLIIIYLFPMNPYLIAGFWTILLQTLQLVAANFLEKRGESNEKTYVKI